MNNVISNKIHEKIGANWTFVLPLLSALISFSFLISYIQMPLLDAHAFRQTQTSLTAYWLLKNGIHWPYETPVAGYPWSIPMEFPVYQFLCAALTSLTDLKLDISGRIVSWISLIACAYPILKTGKLLKWSSETVNILLALLWTHPVYLYWGRTFTIETNTLFYTFMAIPFGIKLAKKSYTKFDLLSFTFWISLGLLQKVTTAFPVFAIIWALTMYSMIKKNTSRNFRAVVEKNLIFAVPAFLTIYWTHLTDMVKALNPMQLTSDNLQKTYFGTVHQRFDLELLDLVFIQRCLLGYAGAGIFLSIIAAALLKLPKGFKIQILISLVLFSLPILIFFNVHYWHNYYQVANIYGLLIPVALMTGHMIEKQVSFVQKVRSVIIAITIICFQLYVFSYQYLPFVRNKDWSQHPVTITSEYIKKCVPENHAIVVFGADWSSETAYYSERKSFTVPNWHKKFDSIWLKPQAYIGDMPLGAIVFYNFGEKLKNRNPLEHPFVKGNKITYLAGNKVIVCTITSEVPCQQENYHKKQS